MDNSLNRSKYKKVSDFRRTKRTQNYESLHIKASGLCPKSGFQDVAGQIFFICLMNIKRAFLCLLSVFLF